MSEVLSANTDEIPGHQDMVEVSRELGDVAWHRHEYDGPLDYMFIGNIALGDSQAGDVYMSEARTTPRGRGVLLIRSGDTAFDTHEGPILPYHATSYETLMTGEGLVQVGDPKDDMYERQSVLRPWDSAIKLAIGRGWTDEAVLVRSIKPRRFNTQDDATFRYPVVAEAVADLQGFRSVKDWRESWNMAMDIRLDQLRTDKHIGAEDLVFDAMEVHKILDEYTRPNKK